MVNWYHWGVIRFFYLMAKLPYIPLYIGDWEQDTNTISLEAEGALLKLIFKLWNSETKGRIEILLSFASVLLKKNEKSTLKILRELEAKKILNIEFCEAKKIKIESRRLLKEAAISDARRDAGRKGGKNSKQNASKTQAKHKQNPEYEYEYNVLEKVDNINEDENLSEYKNGEKKNFLKENGFLKIYQFPNEENLELILPEINAQSAKELYHMTKQILLTDEQIAGFWKIFKVQNFTGSKFYSDLGGIYSHFINWIKNQKIEENGKQLTKAEQRIERFKRAYNRGNSNS